MTTEKTFKNKVKIYDSITLTELELTAIYISCIHILKFLKHRTTEARGKTQRMKY